MYVDLYVSATGFIFRNGATETGRAPFNTLVLEPSKKATDDELRDMNFELKEFVERCMGNDLAWRVKIRDALQDLSCSPSRYRVRKYASALLLLTRSCPDSILK